MQTLLTLFLILTFAQAAVSETRTITVDGYCCLEGQSQHSDTKVKFIKVSPSAVTDSTCTDSSGYFFLSGLYEGIYDVEYTHAGFDTILVEDQVLVGSMTLLPVTLLCAGLPLSGPLSGTLEAACYRIVGDISINSGDSLCLMPGTTFMFNGPYAFRIYGTLLAVGTVTDSIKFTTSQSGPNRWRGLRFDGSGSSGSQLAYCPIESGYATGSWPNNCGGAVYCGSASSPTFVNCSISSNWANEGGGVYCYESSAVFTHCTLSGNSAAYAGGAVYCRYSAPTFTNCMLGGNSVTGSGDGYGGGVYCLFSSPTFTNCTVNANWATGWFYGYAGGVYCNQSSPIFINCTVIGNWAYSNGAGVYCGYSSPVLNGTIIAFSNGPGIYFDNSGGSQIVFCDIFGNGAGNFGYWNGPSDGPPMIGVPLVLNANGDSADIYMNIFVDPMFADTAAGDYHLTDFSHCIGAGDPASTVSTDFEGDPRPNPSWSFPDIGADEHWSGSPVLHLVVSMVNGNARLNWTPFGAGPYSIYGATEPFTSGTSLGSVSDTTTWTDEETPSRPSRYFYYVMAEWPSRGRR